MNRKRALQGQRPEAFRGDERGWFLEGWLGPTLSTSQGTSLIVLVVALGVFGWGAWRARIKAGRAGA